MRFSTAECRGGADVYAVCGELHRPGESGAAGLILSDSRGEGHALALLDGGGGRADCSGGDDLDIDYARRRSGGSVVGIATVLRRNRVWPKRQCAGGDLRQAVDLTIAGVGGELESLWRSDLRRADEKGYCAGGGVSAICAIRAREDGEWDTKGSGCGEI